MPLFLIGCKIDGSEESTPQENSIWAPPRGHATKRFSEGFIEGSSTGSASQRVLRRRLIRGFGRIRINSVQTRCIVKGEAQKSPLFWRFSGVFDFLRIACSLGIPQENL